jgi:two-component sensor histidine kinase
VFRLFEDSGGRIWVSTTSAQTLGLARWDPVDQRLHDMAGTPGLPSLKEELPRAFAEDRAGNIWIGLTTGLARFADGAFTVFTAADGLPTGRIMNLYVDHSGRLWFTSDTAGLVHVDHAGDARPTFVSYSTAQGLASNSTEAIVEDANGYLYVGGGNGLDRFDPATLRVKHFTTADGLPAGLFRAAFRDRTGVLWFGMTGGLARLVPMLERPAVPPPVVMIGVRVSGKPQPVSALGERDMSLPDIAPDQNQVQIDFVGLGFRSGDVLRYQYRLDGADPQWSAPGLQRTVTYASLAPGRYRFHVQAVNSEGVVSDHPASLGFTILHPFWLRWWFITLSALVVGLAIQTLYRYRVARLLEMANMRTRIATDLHDDIGANLTRIALLSEVAKQTPADGTSGDADGPLSSIARIARESVSSMSDIVWAINPKRESLIDLTRRMRQHAEEVFTLRGIEMHFTAPGAADTLKLGVDVRRDLLLIFKEAINNAVRHSRCSRVDIDLRLSGLRLSLEVADNGAGFDASIEREGQGLVSMRRRALRLNGTLEISSDGGVGTRLTLNIPM